MRVRNRAYRQLRRCPVESLVVEYKQRRAEARKVIKCEKRESWQKFCGTLGSETTVKQVWNLIHRMAGINSGFSIPVLVEGCREVVTRIRLICWLGVSSKCTVIGMLVVMVQLGGS